MCSGIYLHCVIESLIASGHSGSAADFAKNHYDWRRSYFVSMISFAFIISQVVLYYTSSVQTLWIASATLGFGYGGMFGLFPTLMIEWFGLGVYLHPTALTAHSS